MGKIPIPFTGPAYSGPSLSINSQECVNFVHNVDQQGGKGGGLQLVGRFGLDLFSTIGSAAIRGMIEVGNTAYVVAGDTFYSVDNTGTATSQGTLNTTTGRVGMASNGAEIVIVDGTDGWSYLIATDDFAEIVAAGFSGGNDVSFIDQYFVVDNITGGTAQVSDLGDGRTWAATDKAEPESDPDGLVRCIATKAVLWLVGEVTAEPYYNAALPYGFPFRRQGTSVVDIGLAARWAATKASDGAIYLLGQNKDGIAGIIRAVGATGMKISTPPLDREIRGYSTVLDCTAFSFTDGEHIFVIFSFPTAGKTWVYDASMSARAGVPLWSEWRSWDLGAFRCSFHMYFNGKHILGDRTTGKLYTVNWSTYYDNGDIIEGIRTTQHIDKNGDDIEWNSLEIFAEKGVGPARASGGEEPMAMLSYSDDQGFNYSEEIWRSLGWQGERNTPILYTRLGTSADRVFKLRITAGCKRVINGASAEVS